jgi:RNA polymerase sigma-70 factor, ECF subfamily
MPTQTEGSLATVAPLRESPASDTRAAPWAPDPGLAPDIERLWADHAATVWNYAARRAGGAEADDVLADTFLVVCRRGSLAEPGRERAWLLGIASNVLRERMRRINRKAKLVQKLADTHEKFETVEVRESALIQAMLDRQSEQDRELLTLVAWDDLSIREASLVLGIRPSAARMRLSRLRRKLRAEWTTTAAERATSDSSGGDRR